MHLMAAGTGNLITLLGGPAVTIVLLVLALAIGVAFWRGNHHKGITGVFGALLVIMVVSLALDAHGRQTLGAWLNQELLST